MTAVPAGILVASGLLVVAVILLAVLFHSMVYGSRAKLRRRMELMFGGGKAASRLAAVPSQRRRSKAVHSKLKALEASREKRSGHRLREELAQTGLAVTVRQFIMMSFLGAFAAALISFLFGFAPFIVATLAIIAGLGLPRLVLRSLIARRIKKFTLHFADAIDVIVRGIRSGLPVGECFNIIAREAPDPVGMEFRLMVEGQRLGLTLDDALQKAVDRVPTAEMRFFAIVLAIQQTTGGNLAETLSKLSEVLRARKRMRDKVLAMSSEATATAGIIGSLPVVVAGMLALIAPDYIGMLFRTETGHLILFAGATIMATGVFVMRQMIRFDI